MWLMVKKRSQTHFRKYGTSLHLGVVENTGSSHQVNVFLCLPFSQQGKLLLLDLMVLLTAARGTQKMGAGLSVCSSFSHIHLPI